MQTLPKLRRPLLIGAIFSALTVRSVLAQGDAPAVSPAPSAAAAPGSCASPAALTSVEAGPQWNGWGNGPGERRFQSAAPANVASAGAPHLAWAFSFRGGQVASQPAVAGGRLFAGGASGNFYALDARSGCTYWSFQADARVHAAPSVGLAAGTPAVFFGDQAANAYALDAATGALIWKTHLDPHRDAVVTGAPVLADGVLYVPMSSHEETTGASPSYRCCSFRGSVSALDAATGKPIWKSSTIPDPLRPTHKSKAGVQLFGPSGAAVWSSPTIDLQRRAIYVTTGDSYSDPVAPTSDAFLAFDLKTGRPLWHRQMTAGDVFTADCVYPPAMRANCPAVAGHDFDFGASPMLVSLPGGRRALIAGQKSGFVHALDPDRSGAVLWQKRVGRGGPLGGVLWGSAADERNAYVGVSDVLTATDSPPASPSLGGLFALDLATGKTVWHTLPHCAVAGCSQAQSAAVTAIPGVVFAATLDGHLRGFATRDGHVVWDIDTHRTYATVNGTPGTGGSIDGPGAVVADGMLYVNSFAPSGNDVLLAFAFSK